HRSRARAPGAVAEWDLIGIALDERDVFDRKAQPIGRDLRERDLVTLAVRMAAGEDRHFAVAVDAYGRALPAAVQAAAFCEIAARPGAGLVDEGGEPDAQQNTVAPQPRLFPAQRGIVGKREQALQERRRIATVVDASARRGIRKGVARDQV